MKTSDAFERAVKDSLESYEVPYNSADWAMVERELDKQMVTKGRWSTGLLVLLLGGTLALTSTVHLMLSTPGTSEPGVAALPADPKPQPAPAAAPDQTGPAQDDVEPMAHPSGQPVTQREEEAPAAKAAVTQPAKASAGTGSSSPESAAPTDDAAAAPAPAEVAIRPSVTEGCPGTSVMFEVSNEPNTGTRMLWNFGDGSFSTEAAPKHAYSKAGRYEVTLSMSSASGGTIFNKPVSDVIVIHERPEAAFSPMLQEYEDRVPAVHFENKSLKGQSYRWDFGDGSTSTLQVPTHVYKKAGDYTVTLEVTNALGCTDRTDRTVHIKSDYNLQAAASFSPNGDGVEDNFIPDALRKLGRKFRMTVHDPTTGALVYETTDARRPWNGRVNGVGQPCPTGDYVWMVEMKDGEALGGTYNGSISLLR